MEAGWYERRKITNKVKEKKSRATANNTSPKRQREGPRERTWSRQREGGTTSQPKRNTISPTRKRNSLSQPHQRIPEQLCDITNECGGGEQRGGGSEQRGGDRRGLPPCVSNPGSQPRRGADDTKSSEKGQDRDSKPQGSCKEKELETLKYIYLNARSLISKLCDLEILLSERDPDLVFICETWLNETINNSTLNIEGYNLEQELRNDRKDTVNGIGGGILVYSKTGIVLEPIPVKNDFVQFCQFKIISKESSIDKNHTFTVLYRSPNSKETNNELLLELINDVPDNSTLIGDFNLPGINWKAGTCDKKSSPFFEATVNKGLEQMVDFPTHVKGNTLDLLFTNEPENIISVESLGNLGNSDHCIIEVEILFKAKLSENDTLYPDWKNCDSEGLHNHFENVNWDNCLSGKDVETQWLCFKQIINEGIDNYVPKKKRSRQNNCVWMNKNVKNLINYKKRLFKLVKTNKSEENVKRLNLAEKKCKKAVRNAKRNYEKKLSANGSNVKKFHAYIRSKTKIKFPVGPIKKNGKTITDNKKMANLLNQYFGTVFTKETREPAPDCDISSDIKLETVVITQSKVIEKINNLKVNSSPGPDGISVRLLQKHVNSLSLGLAIIYENSIRTGKVPSDWKLANVTPIHKKGSKGNVEHYRPISLTSIPCKILEAIIKDNIVDHLITNSLLKSTQHGFIKNKSTVTNLLEFFEYVSRSLDEGKSVDAIYLDFSKAFDKVPINKLLIKLKAHGIEGTLLKWIGDWLTDRKQRTVINGQFSDWITVLSGVPQGSVLGPVAFIIFINDIDLCVTRQLVNKFADDTKVCTKILDLKDAEDLQLCLDNLLSWSKKWGMSFNIDKCSVIHFGKNNQKFRYKMSDTELQESSLERDLGVYISPDLKPSQQCQLAANRGKQALYQVQKAFLYRDHKIFVNIYKQYVRCHLEYASPAWNPFNLADIDKLENVQKKAVNLVQGLQGLTYEEKLKKLNLETLKSRRIKADLTLAFKIIRGFSDVNKNTWFHLVEHSNIVTRLSSCQYNLKTQRSRTELRRNFFSNRIIEFWNSLPTDVKMCENVKKFKEKLKTISFNDA